jgi:hypothetical protein
MACACAGHGLRMHKRAKFYSPGLARGQRNRGVQLICGSSRRRIGQCCAKLPALRPRMMTQEMNQEVNLQVNLQVNLEANAQ